MVTYMQDDLLELLSLKETSRILGVHRNTLRQWDKKGILKAIRFGKRRDRRYKKSEILQLIKKTNREKNMLYKEQKESQTEKAIDELSRLLIVTEALVKTTSINDVAKVIVTEGKKALRATSGAILRYSEKENSLELISSSGYSKKTVQKNNSIPLTMEIPTTDAINTGRLILIESYEEYILRYPNSKKQTFAASNSAFAAIPLIIQNKILGVLSFSFKRPTHFSKDDVTFMLKLAQQFTNAYIRAIEYENLYTMKKISQSA